jgi:hypothetical protein
VAEVLGQEAHSPIGEKKFFNFTNDRNASAIGSVATKSQTH